MFMIIMVEVEMFIMVEVKMFIIIMVEVEMFIMVEVEIFMRIILPMIRKIDNWVHCATVSGSRRPDIEHRTILQQQLHWPSGWRWWGITTSKVCSSSILIHRKFLLGTYIYNICCWFVIVSRFASSSRSGNKASLSFLSFYNWLCNCCLC